MKLEIAEYAGRTFAQGGDINLTIKKEKKFTLPTPVDLTADELKSPVKV